MIFFLTNMGFPNPTWEKFPHFPVCFRERASLKRILYYIYDDDNNQWWRFSPQSVCWKKAWREVSQGTISLHQRLEEHIGHANWYRCRVTYRCKPIVTFYYRWNDHQDAQQEMIIWPCVTRPPWSNLMITLSPTSLTKHTGGGWYRCRYRWWGTKKTIFRIIHKSFAVCSNIVFWTTMLPRTAGSTFLAWRRTRSTPDISRQCLNMI